MKTPWRGSCVEVGGWRRTEVCVHLTTRNIEKDIIPEPTYNLQRVSEYRYKATQKRPFGLCRSRGPGLRELLGD